MDIRTNSKIKVVILGSTGMLGHEVAKIISANIANTICVNRDIIDAEHCSVNELKQLLTNIDWVINCIGIIKPYIHDNNMHEIRRAILVNALFPHILAQAVEGSKVKVIQIATDCVYDGMQGKYIETDLYNPTDVYGKTKSLGEICQNGFINLRCSIIGREIKNKLSLLEWFLNQPYDAEINGYINHLWNGITTTAFARICLGIIQNNISDFMIQHIVPADILSKAQMLHIFKECYNRNDIKIKDIDASTRIDRTLKTLYSERNRLLWKSAGYVKIPTIKEMIIDIF